MKTQPMRCSQSSSKREVYSNTIPPQKKTRKTPKRQPNSTSKELQKEEQKNPKLAEGKKL